MTPKRKEKRYDLKGFDLKGDLILYPDPRAMTVRLDDISVSGAAVTILSDIDLPREKEIDALVKASKGGNRVPVQFIFNNTRIPVCVLNRIGAKRYGLAVSDNEKLSVLAEKGREFFLAITEAAAKKGAVEADFSEHLILGREFLPEDIRYYIEGRMFETLFVPILSNELTRLFPQVEGRVDSSEDRASVETVFLKYMEAAGKDVPLLVGAEIASLQMAGKRLPLEAMLPLAIRALCENGAFFPDADSRARFERLLASEYLKKRTPPKFRDLDSLNSLSGLIRQRFESFNQRVFFIHTLGSYVCGYYLSKYIPGSAAMTSVLGGDERSARNKLMPWVQTALSDAATNSSKGDVGKIEDSFRQAIYEYMVRRRITGISVEEIYDLLSGKIAAECIPIRERFLYSVCQIIEAEVQRRYEQYKSETEEERATAHAEMEHVHTVPGMAPEDLVRRFVWPEILKMEELVQYQKEIARTWIPAEEYPNFGELGEVVILSRRAYQEFIVSATPAAVRGEIIADYFDEIDLQKIYLRTVESGGRVKGGPFRTYIDYLQPQSTRELILEKVINSPEESKYYILKKPKSYFAKIFGTNAHGMISFIEREMMHPRTAGHYV